MLLYCQASYLRLIFPITGFSIMGLTRLKVGRLYSATTTPSPQFPRKEIFFVSVFLQKFSCYCTIIITNNAILPLAQFTKEFGPRVS